jgi:hypothetical protein
MGSTYGHKIVTDGLVLNLDATNKATVALNDTGSIFDLKIKSNITNRVPRDINRIRVDFT